MPFTVSENRSYSQSKEAVHAAALESITAGLEGSILEQDDGRIEGKFPKTIRGKVLGDRTHIEIELQATANGETAVAAEVYPLDPLGRKLQFGARKGVSSTVMSWFWAHLEHRLD